MSDGFAKVTFAGIRLEGVKALTFDPKSSAALELGMHRVSVSLRCTVAPSVWRALVTGRGPEWRSRMRAAYGRRRGRGKW